MTVTEFNELLQAAFDKQFACKAPADFLTSVDAAMEAEHPGSLARWNEIARPSDQITVERAVFLKLQNLLMYGKFGDAQAVVDGVLEAGE